ncbi:putative ribonuclease H-like domain-containing protein [Tanacetum coccineum]
MAGEDEFHDDNPPPPPPPITPTQQNPHTLSTVKLLILKKGVSTKDVNQKFLRSLPSSWSQVSLVMRTKPGADSLSFDDLYNNLRVFESDVKGSTASSSSTHNVAFVSSKSTNSTNDVSTAYGVSTSYGHNSQKEGSSSYTDELKYSFFANQSSGPQLDHEDLEQGEGCSLMPRNQLALTRPKLSASIAITHGTLLESADQKEIKKAEEEMHGTLDIEQKTIGGDLENRRNLKLCNSGSDTKMSAKDKSGLGYGNQVHEGVLSYENEVFQSVFDNRSSDVEDSPCYKLGKELAKTSDFDSCKTNSSVETLESMHEPVVVEPKVVSQPKVWSDAPIIEEYESDSDDEYMIEHLKEKEKPSFAFVNTVKHVKTPRETVKEQNTCSPSSKVDKRDWNGSMSKRLGLGYGFTKKACFGKGTGQGENRPMWNNVQRLNHQNKFVPKVVLTKTGIFSVNTARQNPFSQAAETSTARKVNTAMTAFNDPQKALKNKGIVDSGCSRHMTGNKAYFAEYQDYNGGPVAFGGFVDPKFPKKVYKVEKALYGLHQAPRAWYATLSTFLLKSGYRRGTIDKTLFIKKDKNDIMLVQVYVDDIISGSTKRSWCDKFEALMKSRFQMSSMGELTFFLGLQVKQKEDGIFISQDKSMIGSLMYLTASRPDIMFAVCACSRVSSFDLEAYSDSDYAGANLDRKSTTRGQFLGRRLISWQCKKQTIVATSTTEAYTICIVKNPVFHSKTKHIEIRHHFIRDAYEKKLIQVRKIHTDDNVADLLTKAFDVSSTAMPKLSIARPKLSTDSTMIESIKLEAMVEERRIFKCWLYNHTTNGHQFTMSNRHQELASPEQTAFELASPKQTALGKDISNPLIVGSLLKTIWLSMHPEVSTT